MNKLTTIFLGTAIAFAMGLSFDLIRRHNSAPQVAEAPEMVFYQPRIDGRSLDIRMMGHVVADPLATAERFCRNQGSVGVVDLMMRPGGATRTIGDDAVHEDTDTQRQVFSMIHCQSPVEIIVASR